MVIESNLKKALMITSFFPPVGGVASFRITKFVKYVNRFNWQPVVLTINQNYYGDDIWFDYELLNDIPPKTIVYRTKAWETRFVKNTGIRWLPFLFYSIIRVIKNERPKLVYITGGPFYPLILGPLVLFIFGIPYVIDLRDPWTLAKKEPKVFNLKLVLASIFNKLLEPTIIKYASKVICVSNALAHDYQKHYKKFAGKFEVITNGYDPEDFESTPKKNMTGNTIVYAGKFKTFEAFRDPYNLFCAIKKINEDGEAVNFIHVGKLERNVVEAAKKAGIEDKIINIGPLTYKDTISYLKGASLLVIIGGGQKSEQTAKVFDCLACRRPILALTNNDSELANVLRDVPFAYLTENKDPHVIADMIQMIFSEPESQNLFKIPSKIECKYNRELIAKRLSIVFNETLGGLYRN